MPLKATGKKIKAIRRPTDKELKREGWIANSESSNMVVIELEDGTIIYPTDASGFYQGAIIVSDGKRKGKLVQP